MARQTRGQLVVQALEGTGRHFVRVHARDGQRFADAENQLPRVPVEGCEGRQDVRHLENTRQDSTCQEIIRQTACVKKSYVKKPYVRNHAFRSRTSETIRQEPYVKKSYVKISNVRTHTSENATPPTSTSTSTPTNINFNNNQHQLQQPRFIIAP